MMFRRMDALRDKETILEFHCQVNYESDTSWARKILYDQYREKWFSTGQPDAFYAHLVQTMEDDRTIAEIVLDEDGEIAGYMWVMFTDIPDYDLTIAEVMDVYVTPEHRQRGVGLHMMTTIEQKAVERGAHLLRSETGMENIASQRLHEKFGFEAYRVLYEKKLR